MFFGITLEPVTYVNTLGVGIIDGAQVTTDLLLQKICNEKLNFTQEICANFTTNESIENEVQRGANDFLMVSGWIQSALALFYSLFAGSLADDFGFKPLIIVPLIGLLLSDFAMLLNYIFISK